MIIPPLIVSRYKLLLKFVQFSFVWINKLPLNDVEFNKIDDNDDNFINDIKYKFIELNIDDDYAINISSLSL